MPVAKKSKTKKKTSSVRSNTARKVQKRVVKKSVGVSEVLALLKAFIHFYQVQEDYSHKQIQELTNLVYLLLFVNVALFAFVLGVAFKLVHF